MQVLVIYYSKSGNTQRLAEEVAEGVKEVKNVGCVVKAVKDVTKEDFLASQGIIAGSPVYFGSMAAPLKEMFDKFVIVRKDMGDKVGAAFVTSGDPTGGKETTLMSIIQAFLIYGMIIVGDPLDATGHYGVACTGSPDDKTSANARKLGNRVANLVKQLQQ
ncbi:MAG: flavodoxin family protein [Syntrophobacterales bacterium]|jgi:NAD(P)H dehydrogenase (quinone)|nr:flavodoxin family protein [Syntrophobacterales bacterium]